MTQLYYMPTKLVHGIDSLSQIGDLAKGLGMSKVLLVTDPAISTSPTFDKAKAMLDDAGVPYAVFDECEIDARLRHVDQEVKRILDEGLDGVISIGGGSVMCAGKAMAIAAGQGGGSFANYAGFGNFSKPALPMIMVPTTAGSGSEVSQVTLVKDDIGHKKFLGGGPLSFPQVAILDPIVLETCPQFVNAVATVDAITHAMDSLFNTTTTPLTASMALEALRVLVGGVQASIFDKEPQAMADHLLASSMANMSCGNAKLGLSHTLSLPMESGMDLTHGVGVGVLMPRVFRYSAGFDPGMVTKVAQAWDVDASGSTDAVADRVESAAYALFEKIGFPRYYDPAAVAPDSIASIALEAGRGLYGEGYREDNPNRDTTIPTFNLGTTTIGQGEEILAQCWA
jgi:alcohol dehydrogenase class IV